MQCPLISIVLFKVEEYTTRYLAFLMVQCANNLWCRKREQIFAYSFVDPCMPGCSILPQPMPKLVIPNCTHCPVWALQISGPPESPLKYAFNCAF
ncbi:hypothetical protein T4D_13420 [Trichinella pseudospiralis]|uniref:Uncharacterized protein n=1 Tax=Trichinella pseudospiralis TaxID=6337 RepID=A0A0V1FEN0_TRIPS|nr:hypothetical protein T4D_13420 [Trichinella pseudospiralis]